MKYPTAIIGAGAAGIAAAVQLTRFGLPIFLFEGKIPGGLLHNAHWVENYPGFPNGISGAELALRLNEHLSAWHIRPIAAFVRRLDYHEGEAVFFLDTGAGLVTASVVIAAAGTTANSIPAVEKAPPEVRRSVFYEVRDVLELREEHSSVVIAGAGDAAFDYALSLADAGKKEILIIHRGNKIRALPLLTERCAGIPAIRYLGDTAIRSIDRNPEGKLAIRLFRDHREFSHCADILLVAAGRSPNNAFFSENIIKKKEFLESSQRLIFAGDICNGDCRQAVIAAGNGLEAAMKIRHYFG